MNALIEKIAGEKKEGKLGERARFVETLSKLGMLKESQPKPPLRQRVKASAKKAGKIAKWGGLGLGVYLALKALEGAGEAKREATHRW